MKRLFKKLVVFMTAICILTGASVSYVSAATTTSYFTGSKFNKHTLKYYIDTTPTMTDIPDDKEDNYLYWNSDIQSAFNMWNSIMEIYSIDLSFTKTNTKSEADIIVRYYRSPSLMNVVHTWSSSTVYKTSTINVDDYQLITQDTSSEQFWLSILHEIGHTIGLADIEVYQAAAGGFTSIMVYDVFSMYHTEFPTYDFDRYNLIALYGV